jgi:hypothetical protein
MAMHINVLPFLRLLAGADGAQIENALLKNDQLM